MPSSARGISWRDSPRSRRRRSWRRSGCWLRACARGRPRDVCRMQGAPRKLKRCSMADPPAGAGARLAAAGRAGAVCGLGAWPARAVAKGSAVCPCPPWRVPSVQARCAPRTTRRPGGATTSGCSHRTSVCRTGINPLAGCVPSVPTGEKLAVGSPEFLEMERLGTAELPFCGFVLVAGGLGERLGYPGTLRRRAAEHLARCAVLLNAPPAAG